jgi:hypothetical protein
MKWLLNIFLTLIAAFAVYHIGPYLLIAGIIICILQAVKKVGITPLSNYFYEIACVIDELGNVIGGPFFNRFCFRKNAKIIHKFGSRHHTISMIAGINWHELNLATQIILYITVELWDKGHFGKAAANFEKLICTKN